ncbi:hypothetical protein Zmor_027936 [Zophobas morio]|uniref:Uncharacterized protein n=1 Tax=Zophobas morio TaxID=2755281 RepID=A0AA38HUL7_9CUCU|nr:hypothetical protein Zmor_027936 [Zophobas morio]
MHLYESSTARELKRKFEVYQKIKSRPIVQVKQEKAANVSAKDTTAGPLDLRQEIQKNHLRLGWAVTKAISCRKHENLSKQQKISFLKHDIDNSLSHVFGQHKECQPQYGKTNLSNAKAFRPRN